MDRSPRLAAIIVLALLALTATLMAGCAQQQPLTVKLTDHATYGRILTDSTGKSLYVLARDVPNTGAVANLGEISRFYPPFYAETVVGGNGINISEFGHIKRADGKEQTTFRGWPLYYYINDKEPGDAKSQGANNITFLAKPDYTVMVRENATVGVYLSDTAGAALLVRENDTAAPQLPGYIPFRASPVVGPVPLVQAADFGEATGPSGVVQTTFRGRLLYSSTDHARSGAVPQDGDGYQAVILAAGGTLTSVVEATPATPDPSSSPAGGGTVATSVPATTAEATATSTTRSRDDAYTGGVYTPTPFQTAQVISRATESATPTSDWTPISTDAVTAIPTTPLPTITTLKPATTAPIVTNRTVTIRTTAVPATRTPATPRTTAPPTLTTKQTTVPIPITTSQPTTAPISTMATTLPPPLPTTRSPSTAVSTLGGNAS